MSLTTSFNEFLSEIRPTSAHIERAKLRHTQLREKLLADKNLAPMIVTTFLQGSYRRATILRPTQTDKMDVDLVVVTTIDERLPPSYAFQLFEPFVEQHYPGKWVSQGRSIGIKLSDVELDLVITAKPSQDSMLFEMAAQDQAFARRNNLVSSHSFNRPFNLAAEDETVEEWFQSRKSGFAQDTVAARQQLAMESLRSADEWRKKPLRIPDRDSRVWQDTHPLAQIEWTKAKNASTNGHYVNIVKAIKWWRRETRGLPKYPKSYPLEHMIGQCCPDDITSFPDGLRETFESIANTYRKNAEAGTVPYLPDHGCPDTNVLSRVDGGDFQQFHRAIDMARVTACRASDCQDESEAERIWRGLLGSKFPLSSNGATSATVLGGFSPRQQPSDPSEGRFA